MSRGPIPGCMRYRCVWVFIPSNNLNLKQLTLRLDAEHVHIWGCSWKKRESYAAMSVNEEAVEVVELSWLELSPVNGRAQ